MENKDIYSYIKLEEANYALPVQVVENWEWSMKDHIILSVLYKNSTYSTGKDDNKPFKNITRPILNLQYRAEGFDVKDIVLYVDNPELSYKSFMVRKYNEKWARENNIDTFIDEMVESYIDFGGVLVKNVNAPKPEVVKLQSIAFCDQTDIMAGVKCFKHFYSPAQLKEMSEYGWGEKKNGATVTLDELVVMAQDHKVKDKTEGKVTKTPGKYIEIYELHGEMPENYLKDNGDPEKYVDQMQIVAFYKDKKGEKQGVTLFKGKQTEKIFKFLARDEIFGRALGLGGAEELFEPQVWTNYDILRIKGMLDHASKVIYKTTDSAFTKNNDTRYLENGETLTIAENSDISQLDTYPRNMSVFEQNIIQWENNAQQLASAQDPIMGESPKSGTPFKLQELVTNNAQGLHDYRKGKLATFLDEIYRDWIIPHISKELSKEQVFSSELTLDEMQKVSKAVIGNKTNEYIKEHILNGELVDPDEVEMYKQQLTELFKSGGNKKFFKILKDELKKAKVDVKTNIAGKQAYLREQTDKLVNVFRQVISNPGVLADPAMAEIFNKIIETSGLDPIDFSGVKPQQQPQQQQQPIKQLTNNK